MMTEEIRFYRWQWRFSANDEVPAEEVSSLRRFVRAYLIDGRVDRAETVKHPDEIELVIYYDQEPSDALMKRHQRQYGRIRFSVSIPHQHEGEHTVTEVYDYDADALLTGRVRSLLDSDDSPRLEWRYDNTNTLYEIVEYEYDTNGEVTVRSRAPDGTIIHEDRPPFSD